MENKKTIAAIIILIILIIGLIVISYFYNDFNTKQINLLTEESNKIIESNLIKDNIDFDIKTERNYATVEKSIKEYMSKIKNIHVEMEEMTSGINPNSIFSAQNIHDRDFSEIDEIINKYKEKGQKLITEYEELISEEKILENINKREISIRKDYYVDLYRTVMLGEAMQKKYSTLEEKIKNEKATLYEKISRLEKIEEFLVENEKNWTIKDDKIQFTNLTKMTEYYNLLNKLVD